MNHIGLFEGIGGFSYAAKMMGWETIAWCEWNPFCQQVLGYHFPKAKQHGDITKTDFTIYRGQCDLLTGGFPCQPYSLAGKRKGKEDERHLWPHMCRAIREIQPRWVVGENVFGLINWDGGLVFNEVQTDLEAEGYEVFPYVLPAAGINAPHKRDRVWFVAYSESAGGRILRNESSTEGPHTGNDLFGKRSGLLLQSGPIADTPTIGMEGCWSIGQQEPSTHAKEGLLVCSSADRNWTDWPTESPLCGRNDGFPTKLDRVTFFEWERNIGKLTFSKWRNESIKAYGNAIVPQVALQIYKAIEAYEKQVG